jgi:hypothetical protein
MPDQNRFGKSSRSYAVDTPRERGIKAYNRNLREGLGSGRNVQRIHQARENRTLNRPPRWDQKLGRDVGTMVRDTTSPFKTALMHGADLFAQGLGSFSEAEKARVGGKFNAPLNVKKGTNAYGWLLDHVIKDEYEDDFKREVKKDNLYWTELNKYAKDKYIGGGQLARGINARNEGIRSFPKGEDTYSNFVRQGSDLEGTGMIGDAAARIANAQKYGKAGFFEPWMNEESSAEPFDDAVTTTVLPGPGYDQELDVDTRTSGPYEVEDWMGPEGPAEMINWQQKLNEETAADDQFYKDSWGVTKDQYDKIMTAPDNLDVEEGLWEQAEGYDDKWLEDALGYPVYKSRSGRFFKVNPETHYVQMDDDITDEVTKLAMSMRTDRPMSLGDTTPPPFLSGDTDWWTPEPEEEDLRGWDWINEPVMKHYGVDKPSEEIERVWPNTPPPGYPHRGRFLKYLDQFGFNTGYDYYNE